MAPLILSRIKSLISENYSPNKELDDEINRIRLQRQNIKSAITLPMMTNKEENETLEISMSFKEYFERYLKL